MNLTQVEVTLSPVVDGDVLNVSITPNARRTIARMPHNTGTDGIRSSINLLVDVSSSVIGDELLLICSHDTEVESTPTLIFSAEHNIRMTACGGFNDGGEEEDGSFSPDERYVGRFWFDGTAFVNTYDNC